MAVRPAGERQVEQLPPAVREADGVPPRLAVREIELHLLDVETGTHRVDRHPRLDPEPGRERKHLRASTLGEEALPRERLGHQPAAAARDQGPRGALREPEPAAGAPGEARDREIGAALDEQAELTVQVGVAEQQRA